MHTLSWYTYNNNNNNNNNSNNNNNNNNNNNSNNNNNNNKYFSYTAKNRSAENEKTTSINLCALIKYFKIKKKKQ